MILVAIMVLIIMTVTIIFGSDNDKPYLKFLDHEEFALKILLSHSSAKYLF